MQIYAEMPSWQVINKPEKDGQDQRMVKVRFTTDWRKDKAVELAKLTCGDSLQVAVDGKTLTARLAGWKVRNKLDKDGLPVQDIEVQVEAAFSEQVVRTLAECTAGRELQVSIAKLQTSLDLADLTTSVTTRPSGTTVATVDRTAAAGGVQ